MASSEEVAHIIPTHERPRVAKRLIQSIRHHYPQANIYVCDDSRDPHQYEGAVNVPATAYDIGLSAKRNLLVQASDEPYVFLWDDDYICTSNTSVRGFLEVLKALDSVGVVGGEWTLEHGNRDVWFTGRIIPDGATLRLRPPSTSPATVSVESGAYRVHRVDLLPNWFLADRRTLEACPWDPELKVNEHLEFFARLTALRAQETGEPTERGARWLRRWKRLEAGKPVVEVSENGKVAIQAKGTFRSRKYLSHLDDNRISRGDWTEVDEEYAQQLCESGKAVRLQQEADTRPFPLPSDVEAPLGAVLCPDFTCRHHREEARGDGYDEQRFRRNKFMPLQKAKLGISERDLVQWSQYQYEDPNFTEPEPDLLQLPDL